MADADAPREDCSHAHEPALRRRAAAPLRPAGPSLHVLPDRAAVHVRFRRARRSARSSAKATTTRSRAPCRSTCTCRSARAPASTAAATGSSPATGRWPKPTLRASSARSTMTAEMFDRDRDVVQLHFGGGTPNFLSAQQLRDVVNTLRQHFHFADRATAMFRSSSIRAAFLRPTSPTSPRSGSTGQAWACRISTRQCRPPSTACRRWRRRSRSSRPAVATACGRSTST